MGVPVAWSQPRYDKSSSSQSRSNRGLLNMSHQARPDSISRLYLVQRLRPYGVIPAAIHTACLAQTKQACHPFPQQRKTVYRTTDKAQKGTANTKLTFQDPLLRHCIPINPRPAPDPSKFLIRLIILIPFSFLKSSPMPIQAQPFQT